MIDCATGSDRPLALARSLDLMGNARQRNKPLCLAPPALRPDMTTRVFPDLTDLGLEAETHVRHPDFDEATRAFCRGLADFHSIAVSRRTGVVDTVTWAVAILLLYLDSHSPERANASQLVAICAEGKLAGATAVRNAITLLQQGGMIVPDRSIGVGRAHRLRPTPELIETTQDNLSIRLVAMEPVIPWPKPAAEWAKTEGVLAAFVRGNVEAYSRERYTLFQRFPEIRGFMNRHCGYHIFLDAFSRLDITADGGAVTLPLTEISERFSVSRTHVRKLFAEAALRAWLDFEPGGRLTFNPEALERYRLWFGHEFAWARRLVGTPYRPESLG